MLLGRAFQIRDDILDYEGSSDIVGKETGKDVALGKGIVALVGIEKSKTILSELERDMQPFLDIFSDQKFHDVVNFVVHRVK
jgi:geranylgeranyl pyrophosphate synthase